MDISRELEHLGVNAFGVAFLAEAIQLRKSGIDRPILLLGGVSTAAFASVSKPTAEERAACMGDAMTLCITAIPNRARIASCLASKMSQLSPRCRAQFDKAASGR